MPKKESQNSNERRNKLSTDNKATPAMPTSSLASIRERLNNLGRAIRNLRSPNQMREEVLRERADRTRTLNRLINNGTAVPTVDLPRDGIKKLKP